MTEVRKESQWKNFVKGILSENPNLVAFLGMCPTLAVSRTVESALGMGIAVVFVLVMSNLIVSLIRKLVPNEIRIPVYIVIIATLVTIVEMVMAAYLGTLYETLGVFLPLVVVNCIILGRAEAYASKNTPLSSVVDALGMAVGFTMTLVILAVIREFLGTGTITIWTIPNDIVIDLTGIYSALKLAPSQFFLSPVGAFLVLGLLVGSISAVSLDRKAKREKLEKKAAVK